MTINRISEYTKHVIDVISVTTVVGTLTTWLPPIAAFFSITWTILRIWEMWTGKSISERRKIIRIGAKKNG